MELSAAPQLIITVGLLAVVVLLLVAFQRQTRTRSRRRRRCARPPAVAPTPIIVVDLDDARRMLVDHAESFMDRPVVPLPVDLDEGYATRTYTITTLPYGGALWRALRNNLTANVLHPSRLAGGGDHHHLAPLLRDAVGDLVAKLSAAAAAGGGGGEAVVVRDSVYDAVFVTMARLCFGDGSTGERDVRAMRRALHDFFNLDADLTLLARSRLARLAGWRQWRYLVGTRARLLQVFGPVVEARRQYRLGGGGRGGMYSYVDSLLDLRIPVGDDDGDGDGAAGGGGGGECRRRRALRLEEMIALVWEFLGASTEPITACVEWTLAHLTVQTEIQEKLYRELELLTVTGDDDDDHQRKKGHVVADERLREDTPYLRAVILESLRLHPPASVLLRDVGPEGAAVAGAATPTTTLTRFLFMGDRISRDPKAWTDPDEFRPERFLAGGEGEHVRPVPGAKAVKMLPFGVGRRSCPGAGLAMAHIATLVSALVREFHWAPPDDGGGGVDLTEGRAVVIKAMASPLRARITPRRMPPPPSQP